MSTPNLIPDRRAFLGAMGAAFFTTRGLFAEQLLATPPQTEGPFYPDKLPLDTDNDLIILNDGLTPAVGEIAHLTEFDYVMINNNFDDAVEDLVSIVRATRLRIAAQVSRHSDLINSLK